MNIINYIILAASFVTAIGVLYKALEKVIIKVLDEKISISREEFVKAIDKIEEKAANSREEFKSSIRDVQKQLNDVQDQVEKSERERCKSYIVTFLSDIEKGIPKNEEQKQQACSQYDHYTNDLHGNSYIHTYWERVFEKEG